MNATIGTKPPYYGNIAVAAFLGNTLANPVAVANIPLSSDFETAYVATSTSSNNNTQQQQQLLRALVINMHTYNTTANGTGLPPLLDPQPTRTARTYTFAVPQLAPNTRVAVQRLSANGSDAITGITWDSWSYNYELARGMPVRLANVTSSAAETLVVSENQTVAVTVPDAGAALLWFVGNGTVPGSSGGDGPVPVSVAVRDIMMTSAGLRAAVGAVGAFWAAVMGWV